MAGQETSPERGTPTTSQQRLIDFVKAHATTEGGETQDIVLSGRLEIRPGITLVAAVIDTKLPLGEPARSEDLLYSLQVVDEAGNSLEAVDVDTRTFNTYQVFDEAEPYADMPSAPDYAIDSFFDRYWLHNAA